MALKIIKKYSNICIIQCHFAHQYTHVHSPLIVPGPPRWVVGHGTDDRTFTWLQRTKIYFPFFFHLTPKLLQYKHNSPWFITVLQFRDIPKFRLWVAHCSLNAPRWMIIVSGCRMQTYSASACRQLSLTVGYYKFPEWLLADRTIEALLRHPFPYTCHLSIITINFIFLHPPPSSHTYKYTK